LYFPNTEGGDVVHVYDDFRVTLVTQEVKAEWIISSLLLHNLAVNNL
jgi:hypothetical protein